MKVLKILLILLVVYVGIVVTFESLIGYFQPQDQSTLIITTTDKGGNANERVLASLKLDEELYVAANHWPRSWYYDVLERPQVEVEIDGAKQSYVAVPVTDEERARLEAEHGLPLVVKILTGFPPRRFVHLEPA